MDNSHQTNKVVLIKHSSGSRTSLQISLEIQIIRNEIVFFKTFTDLHHESFLSRRLIPGISCVTSQPILDSNFLMIGSKTFVYNLTYHRDKAE